MMQLDEFKELTRKLSRRRIDGSRGGIPVWLLIGQMRKDAEMENYEYNMGFLFDLIAREYFKVREIKNVDIDTKIRILEYLITTKTNIKDFCKKLEKLGPFHAYLDGCKDGSVLYTISGKNFIYTFNVSYCELKQLYRAGKYPVPYYGLRINAIRRRDDGKNYEQYYEV